MKKLNKIYKFLLLFFPVILYFSYFPVISLGRDETMNFEFSLPLIWLVIFDVVAIVMMVAHKKLALIVKKWIFLLFPIFVSLSILWSSNIVRGVLTAGIIWALYIAVFAVVCLKDEILGREFWRKMLKVYIGATILVCVWCLVQCILDVAGVPRENSLLCEGCVSGMFGFPHPNGFAIEPQFMGNLLLAPAVLLGAILITACPSDTPKAKIVPLLFVVVATLFLTLSRGAIYAFIVAMIFLTAFSLVKAKKAGEKLWKKIGILWITIILSFVFTLNLQGILAEVGPTTDTYGTAVTKVLNHLSLGIIDLRAKEVEGPIDTSPILVASTSNVPIFDGYVEESTEIRKTMSHNALVVWSKNPKNVLFGVGLGGAGKAMQEAGLISNANEIVQNQYVSLLLEVGVVGVALLLIMLYFILKLIIKTPINSLLLTLILAYGISLCFFAGLPNALHIYLMPALIYAMLNGENGYGKMKVANLKEHNGRKSETRSQGRGAEGGGKTG